MYVGKLMEVSPAEELYTKPIHPYTAALLEAIPIPDPRENCTRRRGVVTGEPPNPINPRENCTRRRGVVTGEPPNPINPPAGCVLHPR